jgi:hypothetical protein
MSDPSLYEITTLDRSVKPKRQAAVHAV